MCAALLHPCLNDSRPRKILFLGDENVGKTTFLRTFCRYKRDYSKCDIYTGTFLVFTQFLFDEKRDGNFIPIQLLDLPSGTTAESRRDQYPAKVDSIVLCFEFDNPITYTNIFEIWVPESRQYYNAVIPCHILGLKCNQTANSEISRRWTEYREPSPLVTQQQHGLYINTSAEENPAHAITVMNSLIDSLFSYKQPVLSNRDLHVIILNY